MTLADLPATAQQAIAAQIGQQAKLTMPSSAPDDQGYGTSVAISGNTIVVGAPFATVGANQDQGAVYVFTKSGPDWTNITQVVTQTAKLTPSDGLWNAEDGIVVAVSGNTIVVGAPEGSSSPPTSLFNFPLPVSSNGSNSLAVVLGPLPVFSNGAVYIYTDTPLRAQFRSA